MAISNFSCLGLSSGTAISNIYMFGVVREDGDIECLHVSGCPLEWRYRMFSCLWLSSWTAISNIYMFGVVLEDGDIEYLHVWGVLED